MFFYRVYENSFAATLINLMFRMIAVVGVVCALSVTEIKSPILRIVIIMIGIAVWCIGNIIGNSIAMKKEKELENSRLAVESELCHEDADSDTEGEELFLPATISIVRDNAFMAHFAKVKYIVNSETYKVKNKEKVDIITMQKNNTVQAQNSEGEPYQVTAKSGEKVILHFKALTLVSIERIQKDGSKSSYNV